jgi:hypothetical protein
VLKAKDYLLHPPKTTQKFTFDTSAPGWLGFFGSWQLAGGFLQPNQTTGYKVAAVPNCNEGEDITADISRTGNDANNIQGILFKSQFSDNTRLSGYLGAYNGNGVGIIRRFDNYNLATDTGNFATLCSGNASATGSHDIAKIVSRGGVHSLYVNGNLVCTARDRAYGTGLTGVFAFFGPAGGNSLGVDRYIIHPVETVPTKSRDAITADEPAPETRRVPAMPVSDHAPPRPVASMSPD